MTDEQRLLPKLNAKCSKCGITFKRAILLAMIIDAGAKSNVEPEKCTEGGNHDFTEPQMSPPK